MKNYICVLFLFFPYLGVFGQDCIISTAQYSTISENDQIIKHNLHSYRIFNNTSDRLVILFTEDNKTTNDDYSIIMKKINRKYGDFSLSMLAWEANMEIKMECPIIPELFVKVLNPREIFEIIFESGDIIKDSTEFFESHILIYNENFLKLQQVGLGNFVDCIVEYKFGYPYSILYIKEEDFITFLNRKKHKNKSAWSR